MPGPEQLPVWKTLTALAQEAHADSPTAAWMISAAGLTVDFTKQLLSPKVIRALLQLAAETGIPAAREQLFNGATINNTEGRAVLHTSLRGEPSAPFGHLVTETRERLSHFARDVRSGEYRGFSGKSIRTVVHIGIGGSHLGPELAVEALAASQHGLRCRFVANVDGHALARVLAECQPETTLFVVVSKSFGTLETHVNANSARAWAITRRWPVTSLPSAQTFERRRISALMRRGFTRCGTGWEEDFRSGQPLDYRFCSPQGQKHSTKCSQVPARWIGTFARAKPRPMSRS